MRRKTRPNAFLYIKRSSIFMHATRKIKDWLAQINVGSEVNVLRQAAMADRACHFVRTSWNRK